MEKGPHLLMSGLDERCCQKSSSFLTEPFQLLLLLTFCLFLLFRTWLTIIEPLIAPPEIDCGLRVCFLFYITALNLLQAISLPTYKNPFSLFYSIIGTTPDDVSGGILPATIIIIITIQS
jgi:hypothetical protein